jgi:hypothetical protein
VPVARTGIGENEVTTFTSERRSRGRLLCGLFACAAGAVLLIWGFSTGGGAIAAGIILGPAFLAAGIATLKITRFGKVWWGLSAHDKGWAVPGLVVGAGAKAARHTAATTPPPSRTGRTAGCPEPVRPRFELCAEARSGWPKGRSPTGVP